jgi:hypothetical protein
MGFHIDPLYFMRQQFYVTYWRSQFSGRVSNIDFETMTFLPKYQCHYLLFRSSLRIIHAINTS